MTNAEKQTIKDEIEKLKKSLPWGGCAAQLAMECNCKNEAYNEVLSILDNLPIEEQTWITDRMPEEKKYKSDNLEGHFEWTESELVLAWDSMYGPRVDATHNGKWVSETKGGYQGQVCHGIIAWMPIQGYKEK